MNDNIKKACAELYDIIYHMEGELIDSIPDEFLELIEEEMDEEYDVNIDYRIDINQQELLPETKAMLAIVYRDYLCDEEERERLNQKLFNKIEEKIEVEIKENTPVIYNSLEERFASLGIHQEENKISREQVKHIVEEKALSTKMEDNSWFQKILKIFKKEK